MFALGKLAGEDCVTLQAIACLTGQGENGC